MKNTPPCPITGKPLPDGYTIHPTYAHELKDLAHKIAKWVPLAQQNTHRTPHANPTSTPTNAPHYGPSEPIKLGLYDEVQEMITVITQWGNELGAHIPPGHRDVHPGKLAALLEVHALAVCQWDQAALFVDEVTYSVRRLEKLAQPAKNVTMHTLTCPNCANKTRVPPRATRNCDHCGHPCNYPDYLQHRLSKAMQTPLPISTALRVVKEFTGITVPPSHWRKILKQHATLNAPAPRIRPAALLPAPLTSTPRRVALDNPTRPKIR